ncbi:MAG: hypothetical protein ACR2HP_02335 [Ilumatobacteraceae bacterium]
MAAPTVPRSHACTGRWLSPVGHHATASAASRATAVTSAPMRRAGRHVADASRGWQIWFGALRARPQFRGGGHLVYCVISES